jgi:hypothetical protein
MLGCVTGSGLWWGTELLPGSSEAGDEGGGGGISGEKKSLASTFIRAADEPWRHGASNQGVAPGARYIGAHPRSAANNQLRTLVVQ